VTELERLVAVMHRLRSGCPWDAEQTHASLVRYLVEETLEVVEAIEAGDDAHLTEELGDLLLQVVFHAEIAAETGRFDIEDVARRIADKLVARHPYVFSDAEVPDDLIGSWERAKATEKSRASALEGIPEQLSALTRAHKVLVRARSHGLEPAALGVPGGGRSAGRGVRPPGRPGGGAGPGSRAGGARRPASAGVGGPRRRGRPPRRWRLTHPRRHAWTPRPRATAGRPGPDGRGVHSPDKPSQVGPPVSCGCPGR
jgi:XTP/dITP diphosphohydrolase